MKFPLFLVLAFGVAACNSPSLPEPSTADPDSPTALVTAPSYQPVLAGTGNHAPVGVKPWRELNDSVAPRTGRSR